MTALIQTLNQILASMTGPAKGSSGERGYAHDTLIINEFDQSKKTLVKLVAAHANDEDDAALKLKLRQFLKLRWAYIRNTSAAYDQYVKEPLNGMNPACLNIAALIAEPQEPLALVLMPTLRIHYYANLEETLQALTEKMNDQRQRVLDLSNVMVSHDGTCIIPVAQWYESQINSLKYQKLPYFHYLHRTGIDGSDQLLSVEAFEAVKQQAPYNTCVNFEDYLDKYQTPRLQEEDLHKMSASLGLFSKLYHEAALRYDRLLARPCTLYDATVKLYKDLKVNGVKGEGEEYLANPAVYPLIQEYFEKSFNLISEEEQETFKAVRCGQTKTFGQYLLMLKAYAYPLSDKEYAQVAEDKVFTCIDLASNAIRDMLKANEPLFKRVDARESIDTLSFYASDAFRVARKRIGHENLEGSHALLVKAKKGYATALTSLVSGLTAGDLDYLMICFEAFDENQFKQIISLYTLAEATACWIEAENKSPKELAVLVKYMTQFPVHEHALCAAARMGSEALVDLIMSRGQINMNISDQRGLSALQHAVNANHPHIVMKLLQLGADFLGLYGEQKRSLLHWAVTHAHTDIAVFLIQKGASLHERYNAERHEGSRTILSDAVSKNCQPIINACLERFKKNPDDLNINDASDKGWTALHYAAFFGRTGVAIDLINLGARLAATRAGAGTPLHDAVGQGHPRTVVAILKTKPFTQEHQRTKLLELQNDQDYTPLGLALVLKNSRIAIDLVNAGADFSGRYRNNRSLLAMAMERDYPDLVLALMNKGADLSEAYSSNSNLLIKACENEFDEVALACIASKKFDLNATNAEGWTAFHFVARNGMTNVAKELLKGGASLDVQKNDGWTPLHSAANNNHCETLRELLAYTNDLKLINCLTRDDESALDLLWTHHFDACREGVIELVRAGADFTGLDTHDSRGLLAEAIIEGDDKLMEACLESPSLDLEHQDKDGWTALHYAVTESNVYAVGSLLHRGAKPDQLTQEMMSPVDLAIRHDCPLALELLIDAGARLNPALYQSCLDYAMSHSYPNIIQKLSVHTATLVPVLHMLMMSQQCKKPEIQVSEQSEHELKDSSTFDLYN